MHCGPLKSLMAGYSLNSSELIFEGEANRTFASQGFSSSQPLGTIYLWLTPDSPLSSFPVEVQVDATQPYVPLLTFTATTTDTLTLTATQPSNLTAEPASFTSTTGLCAVNASTLSVLGSLRFTLGGPARSVYSDVEVAFRHDCLYPALSVGSSPSSPPDILVAAYPPAQGVAPVTTPTNSTLLTSGPADSELKLYLSAAASPGWPANALVPFTTSVSSSNPTISATVDPAPSDVSGRVTVSEEGGQGIMTTEIIVISTCAPQGVSGTVQLLISFHFALPLNLTIDVQCGQSLGKASWLGLTIVSPSFPTSDPSTSSPTTTMYTAGHVQPTFAYPPSSPTSPYPLSPLTLTFTYSNSSTYAMEFSADVIPQSAGVVSRVVTSYGYTLPANQTLPRLPQATFSLTLTTLCSPAASNLTTRIRIAGRAGAVSYDEILLFYSWPCPWPAPFDVSTLGALAASPNLVQGGVVQSNPPLFPYSPRGGNASMFTINLDDTRFFGGSLDPFVFYVRTSSPPLTFTWELDLSQSLTPQAVDFDMRYNAFRSPTNPPSYSFTLQSTAWSAPLEMVKMRCTGAGDHILTTFLYYGYTTPLQLDFQRQCLQPDAPEGEGGDLSAGAVVTVVLVVLVVAMCGMGCAYNRFGEGEAGLGDGAGSCDVGRVQGPHAGAEAVLGAAGGGGRGGGDSHVVHVRNVREQLLSE